MDVKIVLFLLFVLFTATGEADEIALLHEEVQCEEAAATKNIEKYQPADQQWPSRNEMLDFIEEENAQLRKIKLLDLDVTRAQLLLKQKEIQVKLAALNPVVEQVHGIAMEPSKDIPLGVIPKGVIYIDNEYQAILQVNNNIISVKAGDVIHGGYAVMEINAQQVVLNDAHGLEKIIPIGG